MTGPHPVHRFPAQRIRAFLDHLERLAAGDTAELMPLSPAHDELDAIAFGINVLAQELRWTHARMVETERRKADIEATALREELAHLARVTMVDALTASLAHEINQPLTALMANGEAARRLLAAAPPDPGELRDTLDDILSDGRRAGDVLRRMRTLLRKDATRHEPADVNGAVTEVVKLVRNDAANRKIALDVELGPALEPVPGDRVQIQQVVLNLLLNAFDAAEHSAPSDRRVRLRTSRHEAQAVVEVSDQGPGLSADELTLIFQPFYTTKRHGLGLGLSICRTIVSAHGGSIEAMHNADAGMTFTASFPFSKTRPADPPPHERRLEFQ